MLDEDKQAQKPSTRSHGRGTNHIAQPVASVLLWAQVGFLQAKVELQPQRQQNSAETRCPFPESSSTTLCCAPPNTGRPLMSGWTCPLPTTQHSHCQWTELADLFLHVGSVGRLRTLLKTEWTPGFFCRREEGRKLPTGRTAVFTRWRKADGVGGECCKPQYYERSNTVRGGAELRAMGGKQLVWEYWFPERTLQFVNRKMCSPRYCQNLYKAKLVWKLWKFPSEPRSNRALTTAGQGGQLRFIS